MAEWIGKTAAALQAWYLGQEGGLAIGSVLFGDFNPSGHLCSTLDRTFEENPAYAYWSPARKDWTVDAGQWFTIEATASERNIRLKETVRLE